MLGATSEVCLGGICDLADALVEVQAPVMPTLDDILKKLNAIELRQNHHTALLSAIITGGQIVATQLDQIISDLNTNTNAVSARLDKIIAQLGDAVTPDQLAQLQAVSDHLKALGQDPANPVPTVPGTLTA